MTGGQYCHGFGFWFSHFLFYFLNCILFFPLPVFVCFPTVFLLHLCSSLFFLSLHTCAASASSALTFSQHFLHLINFFLALLCPLLIPLTCVSASLLLNLIPSLVKFVVKLGTLHLFELWQVTFWIGWSWSLFFFGEVQTRGRHCTSPPCWKWRHEWLPLNPVWAWDL